MIKVIKKQLDLHALPWAELPVTDLGHVIKEIEIHRKTLQAIREWRKQCSIASQECQWKRAQRRAAAL